MLAKLQLKLKYNNDKNVTIKMSSVFQGILMQMIEPNYASELHYQQRHPYSQYIKIKENKVEWIISVLTKEAYENIIFPFLDSELTELYAEYHQILFEIEERNIEVITQEDFLQKQYFSDFERTFEVTFLTPTAFKSEGSYRNYPTVRWLFQSLMHKYDSHHIEQQIFDEEVLQMIEERVFVKQYKLKSTWFYLEGTKIPAFVGSIQLYAKMTQSMINLINYLLKYGEFSGVGIKSAIGMGAISVQSKERQIIE